MTDKTCAERVQEHLESRIEDLTTLWNLYTENSDASDENLGNMYEYGLSFDYVAPYTWKDQPRGYFRYQLSWGGPSDEFRIYAEKIRDWQWVVDKIEYWFLDWFDGAKKILGGSDYKLLDEIFQSFFVDSGTADAEHTKAMEDWEPEYDDDEEEEEFEDEDEEE